MFSYLLDIIFKILRTFHLALSILKMLGSKTSIFNKKGDRASKTLEQLSQSTPNFLKVESLYLAHIKHAKMRAQIKDRHARTIR